MTPLDSLIQIRIIEDYKRTFTAGFKCSRTVSSVYEATHINYIFLRFVLAAFITRLPVEVDPVKAILSIPM